MLEAHLPPVVVDGRQPTSTSAEAASAGGAATAGVTGWEESTTASLMHLLRTGET